MRESTADAVMCEGGVLGAVNDVSCYNPVPSVGVPPRRQLEWSQEESTRVLIFLTVHFGFDESGFAEDRVAQGVASLHDELILCRRYEFLQRSISRRARYRHHTSRFRL